MQNIRVNNKIFDSISKAAKFIGMQRSNLSSMLKDKKATTYKDLMIERLDKPVVKKTKRGQFRNIAVLVDGKAYNSITDAERLCGFCAGTLAKPLRQGKKTYKGHTIEYVMPSQRKETSHKKVQVVCITTGVVYNKLGDAALAAGADSWTMSKKMEASGGYVDANGNEYRRLTPMRTKNKYKDTGKKLKSIRKYAERPSRRGVKLNTKETFVPIDTALNLANADARFPIVDMPKPLTQAPVDKKQEVPQIVKDAINDKIVDLLKKSNIYDQIVDLLNYGGFSTIKINKD